MAIRTINEDDEHCPKCGSTKVEYRWHESPDLASQVAKMDRHDDAPDREHIELNCPRCGYVWFALPLDERD